MSASSDSNIVRRLFPTAFGSALTIVTPRSFNLEIKPASAPLATVGLIISSFCAGSVKFLQSLSYRLAVDYYPAQGLDHPRRVLVLEDVPPKGHALGAGRH